MYLVSLGEVLQRIIFIYSLLLKLRNKYKHSCLLKLSKGKTFLQLATTAAYKSELYP